MKKLLTFILACVMVFSMVACGGAESTTDKLKHQTVM